MNISQDVVYTIITIANVQIIGCIEDVTKQTMNMKHPRLMKISDKRLSLVKMPLYGAKPQHQFLDEITVMHQGLLSINTPMDNVKLKYLESLQKDGIIKRES